MPLVAGVLNLDAETQAEYVATARTSWEQLGADAQVEALCEEFGLDE